MTTRVAWHGAVARTFVLRRGERLNGYTHLLGLVAACLGAVWLLARLPTDIPLAKAIGAIVFALSAIALYATSTLFHTAAGATRARWERADHCAIYLLIGGTCTPFVVASLGGAWAVGLLTLVWAAACAGIAHELRPRATAAPSLRNYIVMGWLCVLLAAPLAARLDRLALMGLIAGALVYSAGTPFYRNRRQWAHAHGVWHLFVLGGTIVHYVTVARLVLQATS